MRRGSAAKEQRAKCGREQQGLGAWTSPYFFHTSPPRAPRHGEPQGKRELDEPPRPTSSNASTALRHGPEWRRVTWAVVARHHNPFLKNVKYVPGCTTGRRTS